MREAFRIMLRGRVLVASLVNVPCLGQGEAALAESAHWGRGRGREGVVALALLLSILT